MSNLDALSEADLVSLLYSMNTAHKWKEQTTSSIPTADDEGDAKDPGQIAGTIPASDPTHSHSYFNWG